MELPTGQRTPDLELQAKILATLPQVELDAPIRAVYFLIRGRRVVYVGQTTDLVDRIRAHVGEETKLFDSVRYLAMPVGNLNLVEREFIIRLQPEYNGAPHKAYASTPVHSINRITWGTNRDFSQSRRH